MDLKEERFPLYGLLVKFNKPGVENAVAAWSAALGGDEEDKYRFAWGIQEVAKNPVGLVHMPEYKPEMVDITLQSCLEIFKELAARGHFHSSFMVETYQISKLGGVSWLQKIKHRLAAKNKDGR